MHWAVPSQRLLLCSSEMLLCDGLLPVGEHEPLRSPARRIAAGDISPIYCKPDAVSMFQARRKWPQHVMRMSSQGHHLTVSAS